MSNNICSTCASTGFLNFYKYDGIDRWDEFGLSSAINIMVCSECNNSIERYNYCEEKDYEYDEIFIL